MAARLYFSGHPDTYDRLRDERDEERHEGDDDRDRRFGERWQLDYDSYKAERVKRIGGTK